MEHAEVFEERGLTPIEIVGENERFAIWTMRQDAGGCKVLVHVLSPASVPFADKLFFAPARAAGLCDSPVFCPVLSIIDHPQVKAVVGELPESQTFDRLVASLGPLSFPQTVRVATALAEAMRGFWDSCGMVHGAILPELAVPDPAAGVKLLSPCFAHEPQDGTPAQDIDDFGALLQFLASGARRGQSPRAEIAPALADIVRRCAAGMPGAFATWDEVVEALRPLSGGSSAPAAGRPAAGRPAASRPGGQVPVDAAAAQSAKRAREIEMARRIKEIKSGGSGCVWKALVLLAAIAGLGLVACFKIGLIGSGGEAPGKNPAGAEPASAARDSGRTKKKTERAAAGSEAKQTPRDKSAKPPPPVRRQPERGRQTAETAPAEAGKSAPDAPARNDDPLDAYLKANLGRTVPYLHGGTKHEVVLWAFDSETVTIVSGDGEAHFTLRRSSLSAEQKELWR